MLKYKGGDGSNKQKAVKILEAKSDFEGVYAEWKYLDSHYPRWQLDEQTLILDQAKQYDIMTIMFPDGSKKEFWFDISDFYGREDE